MRPIILSIAGSDPSAGAGVQADLKSIEATGGFGAAAITAITAQDSRGVRSCSVLSATLVAAQLDAVCGDLQVAAVKSGMLGSREIVAAIAATLRRYPTRSYVLDPVMRSTDGFELTPEACVAPMRAELFPLTRLITPNVSEAELFSGRRIRSLAQAREAAHALRDQGAAAVLLTGGHLPDAAGTDLLVADGLEQTFEGRLVGPVDVHGTGCAYSAAIATRLGLGHDLVASIRFAKAWIEDAILHAARVGRGRSVLDPLHRLSRLAEVSPR